ncbi:hypothetical protein VTJ83DRAFT_822 [Remersonia thermophila]|uniref:Uncharacterized protein n=1 Tax=Remersonia thermophila TaxID=72144 RepID=A0ABR4DMM3_9PEZI
MNEPTVQPGAVPPAPPPASFSRAGSTFIPVALTEAALDSPTFRATAAHFADQLDIIERWLDNYARCTAKLMHDVVALEDFVSQHLARMSPPANTSPAESPILDVDHTLPALRRAGDVARDWWGGILAAVRRLEPAAIEPIRQFVNVDLRAFRETRRALDTAQKAFDTALARYAGQSKTKEPSALREDAFAVFETRRAYLKASLDYCQAAPQLRSSLDRLLVTICADLVREMRQSGPAAAGFSQGVPAPADDIERIRGWAKEMEMTESVFRRELQAVRQGISDSALAACKPSRDIEDYSVSTVPFLGSKGPLSMQQRSQGGQADAEAVVSEKQGWLFVRVFSGKPARPTWVRRWYYCRDGIFGFLVQGPQGVVQGDEIGVLLCSARPAVQEERRFCFEIKTKTQTILLQAETQAQLIEWLEVFEVAKKKAIEASMGRDPSSPAAGADPAFSVTAPSIPEFSAKATLDSLDESVGADKQASLPVPSQDPTLGRASFDTPPRRALTAHLSREEGESSREHAARIMHKLDLHRKSTFAGLSDVAASPVTPGQMAAGGYGQAAGASSPLAAHAPASALRGPGSLLDRHPGSLAPVTLARPPMVTSLSKTAVLASANAGAGATAARALPSAATANIWGSNSYASVYMPAFPTSPLPTPKPDVADPFAAAAAAVPPPPRTPGIEKPSSALSAMSHRKTVSVDAGTKAREQAPAAKPFPPNYPPELRAQYAQFRLYFPTAPADDLPVLVFNAAWSSTAPDGREATMAGSGRIFVTPDRMYFYGHTMGLMVAYAINLDSITELTAAPGRDCDFIFLHLNRDMPDIAYSRITIKVFLEDFVLLQARLTLLVDDLQAAEPMEPAEIISALAALSKEREGEDDDDDDEDKHSRSADSWDEMSTGTPVDGSTHSGGRLLHRRVHLAPHAKLRPSPHPSAGGGGARAALHHPRKFQLPKHPVTYEPPDMGPAVAERHFEISAKSCFHVVFGDRSFIFPRLYFERGAKDISQGPWELQDHGLMRRQFRFRVTYSDMLGRQRPGDVADWQTIEVFKDHMTYVVSHVKTPWHLPHSDSFKVVTKIVITHLAKSKCKLAVYTKADWSAGAKGKKPAAPSTALFTKNMVQRQALNDAAHDAEELAEAATDCVRRLGPHSRTKRAIHAYGNIGQQTEPVRFQAEPSDAGAGIVRRPRTLTDMMLETGRSFMESAITSLMMWAFAAVRKLFRAATANRVILTLLAASAAYNLLVVSQGAATWWVERKSARYMQRLGVGPNLMMGRAVYLKDLEELVAAGTVGGVEGESPCYASFQTLLNATAASLDAPYQDPTSPYGLSSDAAAFSSELSKRAARRLRRVRQRMGAYRHDLLVALRVVNSVERQMVQAEWEGWLAAEVNRCVLARDLLGGPGGTGGSEEEEEKQQQQQVPLRAGEEETEGGEKKKSKAQLGELRVWFQEYCDSCAAEERKVMEQRGLVGL